MSGRPTDSGQIGALDPDCRLIGLYLYEGLFKVTSLKNSYDSCINLVFGGMDRHFLAFETSSPHIR